MSTTINIHETEKIMIRLDEYQGSKWIQINGTNEEIAFFAVGCDGYPEIEIHENVLALIEANAAERDD
jgi:hypothetical protein